jgi:hypothetical protein
MPHANHQGGREWQLFLKAVVFSRKKDAEDLQVLLGMSTRACPVAMNEGRTTEAAWIPDTGGGKTVQVFQIGIRSKHEGS